MEKSAHIIYSFASNLIKRNESASGNLKFKDSSVCIFKNNVVEDSKLVKGLLMTKTKKDISELENLFSDYLII